VTVFTLFQVRASPYPYGMSKKEASPKEGTNFANKALILGQVWMEHKTDDEMADFFAYNDIGIPLAFAYAEGIVDYTPSLDRYVTETFDSLLEALNIEDAGFDDLPDLWDALEALAKYNNQPPKLSNRQDDL